MVPESSKLRTDERSNDNRQMNYTNKQMAEVQAGKGFTVAESDENQRNWNDERWKRGAEEGNYDKTRAHLNFEVAKGGVIQPIDTSKSIPQRLQERLSQLGIEDPNKGLDPPKFRTTAKFVFGGSRERMHQLAFGGTDIVDLSKGADNSGVTRQKDIEDWARDIYRFVADKYGEDNIIGFYCHLDETNPHIHATIVPITPQGRLSFKKVFHGDSLVAYRDNMLKLHTELAKVNAKYGLTRGTSIKVSGARHISTEEYRRRLAEECHSLEDQIRNSRLILKSLEDDIKKGNKKVKGLSTMIANLKGEKDKLLLQVSDLRHQALTGEIDADEAQRQIDEIERQIAEKDEKLADKETKLEQAEAELEALKEQLAEGNETQMKLMETRREITSDLKEQAAMRMSHALLPQVIEDFNRMLPHMNPAAMQHAENTLINDLAANGETLLEKAVLLFIGYVDQSTMVAEGGGGGTSSDLPWGRREDEDERQWARRCMQQARSMVKHSGGGRRR